MTIHTINIEYLIRVVDTAASFVHKTLMDQRNRYDSEPSAEQREELDQIEGLALLFDLHVILNRLRAENAVVPLSGDAYFNLMKKTAERVEKWPDWKKGECSCRPGIK